MGRLIHRLAENVASQIAAGEVIERPFSVVKELLDNALDAKASKINIEIYDAGLGLIKIEDDGQGIYEEDLLLAIEPHCTSKIKVINDLFYISSKGFRGEALASIASVSNFSLISKPKEQHHAAALKRNEGRYKIEPVLRASGTTVMVENLFYNVPVRKKFLKTSSYEWQSIETLVKRFALLAMDVHFILKHDDVVVLDLLPAQHAEEKLTRVKKIFGKSFENAVYLEIERSGLHIHGWLGPLDQHKSQNDKLWIYLNGRVIQDKLIQHALKQVYMPFLPQGRYPQAIIYLDIPAEMVDINVHPAKTEVRFEQPRLIYDFILSSLRPYFESWEGVLMTPQNPSQNTPVYGQNTDNYMIPFQSKSSWVICNNQFILVEKLPYQYLVDVDLWWRQSIIQKMKEYVGDWESRFLTMPYIQEIKKISHPVLERLIQQAQRFGIEMQLFGDSQICIRSIPKCLPQFNLQSWTKIIQKSSIIGMNDVLSCAVFSAFDINFELYQVILCDLDETNAKEFAKPLTIDNCKDLFK